jgi:hypothetical protein
MTNPTELDAVHKKLDNIARLQDVHGEAQNTVAAKLDELVGLLRKEH